MPRRLGDDLEAIVLEADENDPRYRHAVVGCNVRQRRKAIGWNQTVLAEALTAAGWHLNQKQVSAMESNGHYGGSRRRCRVRVDVDSINVLSRVLGVTVTWLMDDSWQRALRANVAAGRRTPGGANELVDRTRELDALTAALTVE